MGEEQNQNDFSAKAPRQNTKTCYKLNTDELKFTWEYAPLNQVRHQSFSKSIQLNPSPPNFKIFLLTQSKKKKKVSLQQHKLA